MAQTYTSRATSINRKKLPAVYRKATLTARNVFDYGCGKYTKHIREYVESLGKDYFPYDPYNQNPIDNMNSDELVTLLLKNGVAVDVICSNVLNVIDDEEDIRYITDGISNVVRKGGGTAYFTVYEGDRSGVGRRTGEDQYQRNEPLKSYLRFFTSKEVSATVHNGMIVIRKVG